MPSAATKPYIRLAAQTADAHGQAAMTLEEAAAADGFQDLGADAAQKVRAGLTTLTEILRVHTPSDLYGDEGEPTDQAAAVEPEQRGAA